MLLRRLNFSKALHQHHFMGASYTVISLNSHPLSLIIRQLETWPEGDKTTHQILRTHPIPQDANISIMSWCEEQWTAFITSFTTELHWKLDLFIQYNIDNISFEVTEPPHFFLSSPFLFLPSPFSFLFSFFSPSPFFHYACSTTFFYLYLYRKLMTLQW